MHAPATWRDVFGYLDGETLGLNLDPSHLVWQMIDYGASCVSSAPGLPRPRQGHGDRPRRPVPRGVLSAGMGWQVPRLPGLGEIRWDRLIAALYRSATTTLVVEHEGRRFEGTDEKAGFVSPARCPLHRLTGHVRILVTRATNIRLSGFGIRSVEPYRHSNSTGSHCRLAERAASYTARACRQRRRWRWHRHASGWAIRRSRCRRRDGRRHPRARRRMGHIPA